ncbi:uncharacterized protein K452DRAFT_291238 [Aplosporella prunicola CBS 121167]|uniref:Uncharacterized protein n=1 Tax=Aplosporella prunicola CBS 121167 TaxID=1176127 RepID=A0A6A6B116_9PEZI|nr:uncharacterized protein K452DRAFT_291238 [Aplosporella prunicola CBS 121167]KAF2137882.1 hypothetical protein K452DRAFT_291238 [Aplosporella prunicola CBS 121167]
MGMGIDANVIRIQMVSTKPSKVDLNETSLAHLKTRHRRLIFPLSRVSSATYDARQVVHPASAGTGSTAALRRSEAPSSIAFLEASLAAHQGPSGGLGPSHAQSPPTTFDGMPFLEADEVAKRKEQERERERLAKERRERRERKRFERTFEL